MSQLRILHLDSSEYHWVESLKREPLRWPKNVFNKMSLCTSCANIGREAQGLHRASASLHSPSLPPPLFQVSRRVDFYVVWETWVQRACGMRGLAKESVFSQFQPKDCDRLCQMRNKPNLRLDSRAPASGQSLPRKIIFASCVLISWHLYACASSVGVRLL